MKTPRRVRVVGDLYHGQVPDGAVYVGRAAPGLSASPYANPFKIGRPAPASAGSLAGRIPSDLKDLKAMFLRHLAANPALVARARRDLHGRDLACWCRLDADWCHADTWLALVAEPATAHIH